MNLAPEYGVINDLEYVHAPVNLGILLLRWTFTHIPVFLPLDL